MHIQILVRCHNLHLYLGRFGYENGFGQNILPIFTPMRTLHLIFFCFMIWSIDDKTSVYNIILMHLRLSLLTNQVSKHVIYD